MNTKPYYINLDAAGDKHMARIVNSMQAHLGTYVWYDRNDNVMRYTTPDHEVERISLGGCVRILTTAGVAVAE